ncbi:MAG: MetQ/NlpA family ABC transporter substrate-binding protein [Clostridium sp.]|nr:MetQ/NlpA family ABC transporter substrate-binding protein [Clostridium sp.]
MKKSIKRVVGLTLTFALGLTLAGCSGEKNVGDNKKEDNKITIGVSPEPHKKIVNEAIKPLLEKEGYEVEVVEFTDYVLPNKALSEGELDANYFQHVPYLESTVSESGYDLTYTAKVHIEPMGLYSDKIKDFKDLENGAEIAIPNDPSNGARALKLLAENGLIRVPEGNLISAKDIIDNPKNIKITEVDAEQLPRVLSDVTAAVINTNYALEADLNPLKDALIIENGDSPYANIIAVKTSDKESEKIKALTKAATSKEVKEFIEGSYNGAIIPSF